jgi:hypothetical protein
MALDSNIRRLLEFGTPEIFIPIRATPNNHPSSTHYHKHHRQYHQQQQHRQHRSNSTAELSTRGPRLVIAVALVGA